MSDINVEKIVNDVIRECICDQDQEIKPEDKLADLGLDSLDLVELDIILEERFDIDIPDEDFDEVETVQDVVNVVKKLTA